MNDEYQQLAIEEALRSLKDFQKKTVEYICEQLFQQNRQRMLIADEVGLGKTIVAKGIIAKAFSNHLAQSTKRDFHVVYICSNQALANQNLKKLHLFHQKKTPIENVGRLIYLAFKPKPSKMGFKISALTPSTSIHLTRSKGQADERALILALLTYYQVFSRGRRPNGLRWILKGEVDITNWDDRIKKYKENRTDWVRADLFTKFCSALRNRMVDPQELPKVFQAANAKDQSLWQAIITLSEKVDGRNQHKFDFQYELIITLRQILTEICLEYLKADLFILDEFQRFKVLIDQSQMTQAAKLAQKIFQLSGAKVLLLSATPYKPYTTRFDQLHGEDHYAEFKMVLSFLLKDTTHQFWEQYEKDRRQFFEIMRQPKKLRNQINQAKSIKSALEDTYRQAMVRTERLIVSEDNNAMIKTARQVPFSLSLRDVQDFIYLDQVISTLNRHLSHRIASTVEFVKSAPYALSFLDHYKAKEELKRHKAHQPIIEVLKKHSSAWLDLEEINQYKPVLGPNYPNGKLRQLVNESVDPTGYQLLWIPPSLPYYPSENIYKNTRGFSKTLVFSSWVMVPRMISTLLSYEVERLTIPNSITDLEKASERTYFPPKDNNKSYRRHPRPLLIFRTEKEGPSNMTNFCLLYPSPTLASWYHPRENLNTKLNLQQIRQELIKKVTDFIEKQDRFEHLVNSDGTSEKWYWALPILMDRLNDEIHEEISNWFNSSQQFSSFVTEPDADQQEERRDKSGKKRHFDELKLAFLQPDQLQLGTIPNDIGEVMADLILGSPAITAFRALKDFFPSIKAAMSGAVNIANGFISLFNKPESIAAVRMSIDSKRYWQMVLEYCMEGNIQALLDEFIFLLYECENEKECPEKLGRQIADIMNIRTSTNQVDSLDTFLNENPRKMRCHYALDFGNQRIETTSGERRMINLRETFNSPFRPFVLASTSIGQEGLDFHYYCRKIMHWNLPANPIDLEQREGRINRFMGLVIRQNLAARYSANFGSVEANPWYQLFHLATKEKADGHCDLVPFWHVEGQEDLKIERNVPMYPFSRDIVKYKNILKVLTLYRLTFGQPRQEELMETFQEAGFNEEELKMIRKELMINLSPITF